MRKKMIAGNWKMNGSMNSFQEYFELFHKNLAYPLEQVVEKVEIIFALPYLLLNSACSSLKNTGIEACSQNCHWQKNGAFTGEISIPMLKDLGVKSSLVAHSERRQYFNETNETASQKVQALLEASVMPILCVGESLDERNNKVTETVIEAQLDAVFSKISDLGNLIIAYEPVWAIGTGLAATAQQANEVHEFIRSKVSQSFSPESSEDIRILYGGSMNPKNCEELLRMPHIDGGLVGGASLKPLDFANMVNICIQKTQ